MPLIESFGFITRVRFDVSRAQETPYNCSFPVGSKSCSEQSSLTQLTIYVLLLLLALPEAREYPPESDISGEPRFWQWGCLRRWHTINIQQSRDWWRCRRLRLLVSFRRRIWRIANWENFDPRVAGSYFRPNLLEPVERIDSPQKGGGCVSASFAWGFDASRVWKHCNWRFPVIPKMLRNHVIAVIWLVISQQLRVSELLRFYIKHAYFPHIFYTDTDWVICSVVDICYQTMV